MSTPLISPGALISQSWKAFRSTWKETFNVSVWFLLPPALTIVGALLARSMPGGGLLFSILNLIGVIIAIHTSLRLMQFVLHKDLGQSTTNITKNILVPWKIFFSYLWIGLLLGLAVLGGTILFVLPGIWLGIAFSMASFFLLEDGIRSTQALAHSMALVKGRWWGTFGRLLSAGIVFGLLVLVTAVILSFILGLIGGFGNLSLMMGNSDLPYGMMVTENPLTLGLRLGLQGIIQIIFAPLIIIWQVKLFHSLKDSR